MRTLLVLAALLAPFSAWAEDNPRSYIGVSAGHSDSGGMCEDDLMGRPPRCSGTNLLRVFGGHNFNPHFALEGAVVGIERAGGGFAELAVVGTAPVNEHFAFYGRIGGAFAESNALSLAAGVRFHLGENVGLRFEWQKYSTDSSIELLSAGVFVRF